MSSDFAPPAGATAPEQPYAAAPHQGVAAVHAGPRAGFGARLGAAFLDGLIIAVPFGILAAILPDAAVAIQLLSIVAGIVYYVALEGGQSGQTIGKKALNIRVYDANQGGSIGYGRAFIRYIGRYVSSIPLLLGYFWMLWDGNKQTWHDKFASSVVVPTTAYPVQ